MGTKAKGGAAAASSVLAEGVMVSDRGAPEIPIDLIDEAPENTRRTSWGNMDELTASVRENGQKQPGLVRPMPRGRYELVDGTRRLRALKLVGAATLRAEIQPMTDQEAHEARLVIALQREGITPLEEAEAFQTSRAVHKRSVEEIAARIGRTTAYVHQRLRLLELDASIRALVENGRLSPALAMLLASLPQKLQKDAGRQLATVRAGWNSYQRDDVREARHGGQPLTPISRGDVEEVLADVVHTIASMPFDTADATLDPKAGACTTCSKRTGTQGTLFEEANKSDVCLDPPCRDGKVVRFWKNKEDAAKAAGQKILLGKAAAEAIREATSYGRGKFVRADEKPSHDAKKTYGEIIGDAEPRVIAQGDRGQVIELVPRDIAQQAVAARAKKGSSSDGGASSAAQQRLDAASDKAAQRQQSEARRAAEKAAIAKDAQQRTIAALVASVEAPESDDAARHALQKAFVIAMMAGTWADVLIDVVKRRHAADPSRWKVDDGGMKKNAGFKMDAYEIIVREMADMSSAQVAALAVELVATRAATGHGQYGKKNGLELLCEARKINVEHHEREAKKAADAKKAEKKEKEKAKKQRDKIKAKSEVYNAKRRAAEGGKSAGDEDGGDEGHEDEPDEDKEQFDVDAAEED